MHRPFMKIGVPARTIRAMLHLLTSNRYEILREALLAALADAPADPLAEQEVIVPSAAVKRDVQLALARRHGIAAGVRFPFLASWLWTRIAGLVPEVPAVSPFAPERATWRIFRLLDTLAPQEAPRLSAYLAAADPVMRLDLAGRIAHLFEQYVTYRPDWLAAWSRGAPAPLAGATAEMRADEAWQMRLWQRLTAELGTRRQHPVHAFFSALDALGPAKIAQAGLPAKAHVFALPSLPPLYLDMLARLGEWIDIHLYLVNPCREYWFELVAEKRRLRLAASGQDAYLDTRHPLLADWGRQTQALFGLILARVAESSDEDGVFAENGTDSLLHRFQDSLLDLALPAAGAWPLAADDRSIEIHIAHSLTRQLEILHDQLLARFAADPSLGPADVLVALPDLDEAAPRIDAVFGSAGRLPYQITGQKAVRRNPVARVLLGVLDLAMPPARLPAGALFALLEEPLVAAALDLDADTLDILRGALVDAGARWGLDAAARAAAGLPADPRHTWRDALARLLLGYARPDDTGDTPPQPFADILPAGQLGGGRAASLGSLWCVLGRLEALSARLAQPQTAAGWLRLWQKLLDDWIGPPTDAQTGTALAAVLAALEPLADCMAESGPDTPIAAAATRHALETALADTAHGGVPGGAITFAALPSLRHLPYRMICLLGLDDGVFPSPERPLEFDLMPTDPRPGDRQRRADARNLFLDLLLAARQTLYLSYTGRSQRDDAPLPPSVLVAELRDFLCRATGAPATRFCVAHPLQAFSPRYFAPEKPEPRLISYREAYAKALNAACAPPAPDTTAPSAAALLACDDPGAQDPSVRQPRFFAAPLPAPTPASLGLESLQRFFRHPARALLRERLGLALPQPEEELADEEPLLLDGLGRHALGERLLPAALAGADAKELHALAAAGCEVPSGALGEHLLRREVTAVAAYAAALRPHLAGCAPTALDVRLALGGRTLLGRLPAAGAAGLLRYRFARLRAADALAAWLDHLVLNVLAPADVALCTRHLARDAELVFRPVAEPAERLADWLAAWDAGMTAPLAFYPNTAWAWQKSGASAARQAWLGRDDLPGEADDPWWALARRGLPDDPFTADFHAWRMRLLEPLFDHISETSLP